MSLLKSAESHWFSPYNYLFNASSGLYSFTTDCGCAYQFGFHVDNDLLGYPLPDFKLFTFSFDKITSGKPQFPERVSSTICEILNEVLQKHRQTPVWFICSLNSFTQNNQVADSRFGLLRRRIFTQWFHKYKYLFPDIHFFDFHAFDPYLLDEAVFMGFLWHNDFRFADEVKAIINAAAYEHIPEEKNPEFEEVV